MIRIKARRVLKQLAEALPLLAEGYIKDATFEVTYRNQYSRFECLKFMVTPRRGYQAALYFPIEAVMAWSDNLAVITAEVESQIMKMADELWEEVPA